MLYIISQDGTHYGSSDITLKGKEIYQEGVVIGSYHSDNKAKEVFEMSPFFKSKDRKHVYKWERSDHRYFNYLYNVISGGE